jgi:hypothetical protein
MTWNDAMAACCAYGFQGAALKSQADIDCVHGAIQGLIEFEMF